MCFFSRLRASASTWSFQRWVIHSGLLGLAVAPDSAVPRLARDDPIEPGRSMVFRPSVGTALDVDISHLRSVVAEAVIGTGMSELRRTLGGHATHVPGCRKAAGAHMGIDPDSYRDRHPIPCEVQELSTAVRRSLGVQPSPTTPRQRSGSTAIIQVSLIPTPNCGWPPREVTQACHLLGQQRLRSASVASTGAR